MKLQWTEPAVLDLEDIRDFIARDLEYYALEFVGKIFNAVEKLKRFPQVGRRVGFYLIRSCHMGKLFDIYTVLIIFYNIHQPVSWLNVRTSIP